MKNGRPTATKEWRDKNGKLETLTLKSELNDKKVFNAEVSYLSPQREKFSDEEQALIARVEVVHQQLSQLQAVESSFSKEDELDMPKEIEVLIADKYKDSQNKLQNSHTV